MIVRRLQSLGRAQNKIQHIPKGNMEHLMLNIGTISQIQGKC